MWAEQLIDAAKAAAGFKSYAALAEHIGVGKGALSEWKVGRGSPMPPERVLELCALAGIKDTGPWLIGVQSDAVRITAVREALVTVLDRCRPTVAAVGLIVLGVTSSAFSLHANARSVSSTNETERLAALCIMRNTRL